MHRITVDFSKDPPEIIKIHLKWNLTDKIEDYQIDNKLPPMSIPKGLKTYSITHHSTITINNDCEHCNGTGVGLSWNENNTAIETPGGCKRCNGTGVQKNNE